MRLAVLDELVSEIIRQLLVGDFEGMVALLLDPLPVELDLVAARSPWYAEVAGLVAERISANEAIESTDMLEAVDLFSYDSD